MKEKILKALQTKFEGVDAKILDRVAAKLAKTVTSEEDVQTAVDGVTFQQLLESFGDQRATEATKTAVANYEKKHGLKDGKVVEQQQDPGKGESGDDDTPAWAKKLMERLDAIDADKLATTRKTKFDDLLKDAPENVKKMYEGAYARMTFRDDADFDAYLEGIKPDIETFVNEGKAKGAVVHRPMGGGNGQKDGINPVLKAQYEQQQNNAFFASQAAAMVMGMPASPAPQQQAPAVQGAAATK